MEKGPEMNFMNILGVFGLTRKAIEMIESVSWQVEFCGDIWV
jgi:hypothetical protein